MDIFGQIAVKIIKEQELVIGPLAWVEVKKVDGLKVADATQDVKLEGDKKQVIDTLVARFDRLCGSLSHKVSRGAVAGLLADLTPADIPLSLKT